MRNIIEMSIIQIDITNVCTRSCSNCTRFCGHYIKDKLFFMDKNYFIAAVNSLKDFQGIVGIIGGEPTLHPEFEEFCKILKQIRADKDIGLWSNGYGNFKKYHDLIYKTFNYVNLNNHTDNILHTPILVASEDIINNKTIRDQINNECWIQKFWSATINPKGAFFCEVAGALSYLYDGIDGWDIIKNPDWWKLTLSEYNEQRNWACDKCGCAIPLYPRSSNDEIDDVSEKSLERLKNIKSYKIEKNKYVIYNKGIDNTQIRNSMWYCDHSLLNKIN